MTIKQCLVSFGIRFAGSDPDDIAEDWDDHDFSVATALPWLEIGVWDAATAAAFRDAGISADEVVRACEILATEGRDPLYAACNGDMDVDVIIRACQQRGY